MHMTVDVGICEKVMIVLKSAEDMAVFIDFMPETGASRPLRACRPLCSAAGGVRKEVHHRRRPEAANMHV